MNEVTTLRGSERNSLIYIKQFKWKRKKLNNLYQRIWFPKKNSTIDAIAEVTEKCRLDKTKSPKRTVFLD